MGLVTPGIGLLFWMTLSFVIVLFVLRKLAWIPILLALKEREETIQGSLDAAKQAKEDIAKLQADNQEIIRQAHQERERILKEAKDLGDKYIAEAKKIALEDVEKIKADSRLAIQAEKVAALKEIKTVVAELSLDIAQNVITAELSDTNKQQALVEGLLKDINLS
jgi:F-type H+-transporting ATPase subunit b